MPKYHISGSIQSGLAAQAQRLDFNSTAFDSTMTYLLGQEIVEQAKVLKKQPEFRQRLNTHFYRCDVVADNLAQALKHDRSIHHQLSRALTSGVDSQQDYDPEVVSFIRSAEHIPAFIDRKKVALGGRVFRSKLDLFGLLSYGIPVGVFLQAMVPAVTASLLFTNRPGKEAASIETVLARKQSKRRGFVRILETFKWFNAVAEQGAGDLYSVEFAENCRIRLVHAFVRSAINDEKESWNYQPDFGWQEDVLGAPLSAADSSIVVPTILVSLMALKRHQNKAISEGELEALNHWCNYVSFLQGVPEELLFPTAEQTMVYFAAFIMSMDIQAYQSQLRSFMPQLQDLGFGSALFSSNKFLAQLLDSLSDAALDDVFADNIKQYFGLRNASTSSRLAFSTSRHIVSVINKGARGSGWLNNQLDQQTIKLWRVVIPEAERILSRLHGRVVG